MQITIPAGYFFRQSRNEYSDYKGRLIAELLQNSVDAGAKNIHFNFTPDGYEVIDDGRGMTQETMVSALLTFGGSAKEEGATGGFGHAKILLLFSMKCYEVISRGVRAIGDTLDYTLDNVPDDGRTVVRGWFPEEWGHEMSDFQWRINTFLSKCHLKARVFVNGEEFTNWKVAKRCVRRNDWSKLYASNSSCQQSYISIRKNGLFAFERYAPSSKEIILEVTADSKEVFTANRDGFRGDKGSEFDKIYGEVLVDKKSFDRKQSSTVLFTGRARYFSTAPAQEARFEALPQEIRVAAYAAVSDRNISLSTLPEEVKVLVEQCRLAADFVVDLGKYDRVPKRYAPDTMSVRNQKTLRDWKAALELVFKANKLSSCFRVGFTLDESREAQFTKKDGIEEFLINPEYKPLGADRYTRHFNLIILAAHEVAHRQHSYHDEEFALYSEDLVATTLAFTKGKIKL